MAAIYTYSTAYTVAEGLQGSKICDDAIQCARAIARQRREKVVLEDDDGCWLVYPDGSREELASSWAG